MGWWVCVWLVGEGYLTNMSHVLENKSMLMGHSKKGNSEKSKAKKSRYIRHKFVIFAQVTIEIISSPDIFIEHNT
jgi:hypothetical protein